MKKLLLLLFPLFFSWLLNAQNAEGVVVDEAGIPMIGVNVMSKNANANTITDIDGKFRIQYSGDDQLTFSFIGYETLVLKPMTKFMNVVMTEKSMGLQEVVVVGYGTKKAGSITGSVSQVKSSDIVKTPAQSAIQAIQGKVVGVNIVSNDEPGAQPTILIRGLGTVFSGYEPLYVIDGVETNGMNGLSPNDIETIDILKDASSLAIYGQKGSNGVILITTKKGKKGSLNVTFSNYYGLKAIQKKVKMADSYRFAYYNNTARGSSSFFKLEGQPVNTNWLDEITGLGDVLSNSLSFSGGNDNASYSFGVSNYIENGILNGTKYNRTNLVSKNDFKILDERIKVTQFVNLSVSKNIPKPLTAFTSAYKQAPIMPVKNPNGRFAVPIVNSEGINAMEGIEKYNNVSNPAADLFYSNAVNQGLDLFGSIAAEARIYKDLKYNSNFGATFEWGKGYSYSANREIWLFQNPTKEIADYTSPDKINSLSQYRNDNFTYNWDNFFTFKKQISKHDMTFVAGTTISKVNNFEGLSGVRYNVPEQSNYWYLNFSINNNKIDPGSVISNYHSTPVTNLAYFGRFEYEFSEKYLLSASLRREGISTFQKDKRWDNFPAVSLGWVLSSEEFLNNVKVLNYLKVRGGFGIVGNGRGTPSVNNILFASGANYPFGPNQTINPGSVVPYQIDPNLTWEKMKEIDFGIDFKLFNYTINGTIDLYNRRTDKIILPVDYPAVLSPGDVYVNAGEVTNKGIEMSLNWKKEVNKAFNFTLGGNFSINDNKLSDVYNEFFRDLVGGNLSNGINTKKVIEGESLGSFYVFEVTGFDEDGKFTYSDKKVIAGTYLPKYTLGINFDAAYKNFDFSLQTYGVAGNKVYNGKKAQRFGGENVEYDLLSDFWLPSKTNATNPKPFNDIPLASDYYVENGAFFRINNVTLGYTLPSFSKKLNNIRIYFTALNPLLLTPFSGYSPEISGSPLGGAGIELDAYPTNKTFLFGLNINL
ncbi:MAG: SusC/RagA family TonB-linked outer membrane protein [Deltaproteobacteria bacterium]